MSNLSLFKSQLLSKQEYINENKQTEKLAEQLLPSLNQFETSRCQVYGKGVEGSFCSCAYRTRGCTKSAQRSRCNRQLLPLATLALGTRGRSPAQVSVAPLAFCNGKWQNYCESENPIWCSWKSTSWSWVTCLRVCGLEFAALKNIILHSRRAVGMDVGLPLICRYSENAEIPCKRDVRACDGTSVVAVSESSWFMYYDLDSNKA